VEVISDVGLIHMNGRAYDPQLARFLSVDPFIQFPELSQSLNGYSYVLNNPLSATDPTGYLVQGMQRI
jgi:RHS repeat-associated protein